MALSAKKKKYKKPAKWDKLIDVLDKYKCFNEKKAKAIAETAGAKSIAAAINCLHFLISDQKTKFL